MRLLAFDPSGNYYEGKGITGWSYYYEEKPKSVGQIRAEDFETQMSYWIAHLDLIKALMPEVIVMEEYKLYSHTASAQIGSEFETVQLIGIIKYIADTLEIPVIMQPAKIKPRFSNEILLFKNIVTQDSYKRYYAAGVPITQHILDSIRHAEYFIHFTKKKLKMFKEGDV